MSTIYTKQQKISSANSPRQKYVSKICGNLGTIKKLSESVKFWNILIIKGLCLVISGWFWLFGVSKYINKRHCISILGIWENATEYQYKICMERGEPNPFTSTDSKLSLEHLKKLFQDSEDLINELNESKITHGDIHLGNIVWGTDNCFKLIDFGKSSELKNDNLNGIQIYYAFFQAVILYLAKKNSINLDGVKLVNRWDSVKHLVESFDNELFARLRAANDILGIKKLMENLLKTIEKSSK